MQLHDTKPPHRELPIVPEEVIVRHNGRTQRVSYHFGETLLETLRRDGIPIPSACVQGMCATCMVRRIQGEVALRENHVLTEDDLAAGYTLACQGEPRGTVCEIELEG